jgi:hypothetical protein
MAATSPLPTDAQTSTHWLNAKEAADALGLSLSTLYEQKKRYGGVRRNGTLMFDPVLVSAAAREREARRKGDGPTASIVFKALEDGMEPVQIVIAHGVAPDVVEKLSEAYVRLKSVPKSKR